MSAANEDGMRTDTHAADCLDDVFEFPITSSKVDMIAPALAGAATSIKNATRDSENPFFKTNYASLASVFDACRPHLAENGISILQPITRTKKGEPVLVTRLLHESGQWVQSVVYLSVAARVASGQMVEAEAPEIPGTEKKAKKKAGAQDIAAEITYFRRMCLAALAGVAAEDDDGNEAQEASTRPNPGPPLRPTGGPPGPSRGGPPR